MEKIRCVLVDDEKKVLQALVYTIGKHFPELEIVGTAANVLEAYEIIKTTKPQVVFLDIVMPMLNGFELIKKFDHIDFEIVFITSHQEYALEAIKCLALAYLLKPVDVDDLRGAVTLVKERLEMKHKKDLYDALLHNMAHSNNKEHKLAVYNHDRTELVDIKNIIRLEGWDRYTKIYVKARQPLVSSYNIGKYSALLANHTFYLCHKSHLVNLDYVKSLQTDATLLLADDSTVPLAVRKRQEFMDLFSKIKRSA